MDDFERRLAKELEADDDEALRTLAKELSASGEDPERAMFYRDDCGKTTLVEVHGADGSLLVSITPRRRPDGLIDHAVIEWSET